MTEPDDLAARAQKAQRGLQQLIESTRREGEEATQARLDFKAVSGRASSPDGGIKVVVDHSGGLTGLELTSAIGRFGPQQLAGEILTCVKKAQANLAGQARERLGGTIFGETIATGLAGRFPAPPEPAQPVPGREMTLGQLHEDATAAARQPVRQPRPTPEAVEDEGFGGSVFTRGDR